MTDNEKRAHDLAVAICVDVCHLKLNNQIANAENMEVNARIDYFTEYMNAYKISLESFNREFPDGK